MGDPKPMNWQEGWRAAHNLAAAYEAFGIIKDLCATAAKAEQTIEQAKMDIATLESVTAERRNSLATLEDRHRRAESIAQEDRDKLTEEMVKRRELVEAQLSEHAARMATDIDKMVEDKSKAIAELDTKLIDMQHNAQNLSDTIVERQRKVIDLQNQINVLNGELTSILSRFAKKEGE